MKNPEVARLAAEEAISAQRFDQSLAAIHPRSVAALFVPENWIRAVIRIESGGRTTLFGRPITSDAGAMASCS
jgi:hypothetical protein